MADAYTVRARWDDEAKVWSTDGQDIPGLFCEAASFDELVEIVLDLAPDLLHRPVDITVVGR